MERERRRLEGKRLIKLGEREDYIFQTQGMAWRGMHKQNLSRASI